MFMELQRVHYAMLTIGGVASKELQCQDMPLYCPLELTCLASRATNTSCLS
jgi:hypothetical protein